MEENEKVTCPGCGLEYDADGDEIDTDGQCNVCRPVDNDEQDSPYDSPWDGQWK